MFNNKPKQLSFLDLFSHLKASALYKPESLLGLFNKFINLSNYIPSSFYNAYYKHFGKHRCFSLESMLLCFFVQKLLKLNTLTQLRAVLLNSYELRSFCNLNGNVPSISTFSRFRKIFNSEIHKLFQNISIHAHNISLQQSPELASILIFDTTGIVPKVRENNPKFIQSLLKNTSKANPELSSDKIYSIVYSSLPKTANANSNIRLMFVNGHFCWALKFAVITNALGIPLALLPLFNSDSTSSDPIEHKSICDSKALIPSLKTLFSYIPKNFSTFIADSALDSHNIYSTLKNTFNFSKIVIPLNTRASKNTTPTSDPNIVISEDGVPICKKFNQPFKPEGKCQGKNRSVRFKWTCPMSSYKDGKRTCSCPQPCTTSKSGRMFYTYPDDFRSFPGINRNSQEFLDLYNKRVTVEQTIYHLKSYMGSDTIQTLDHISIFSDFLLSAITFSLLFILAHNIKLYCSKLTIKKLNKLKKLIA
uniref:Transposase n=1 Tax=Caldicellulosiruptor owensensis TaxID=55205 RepID=A0A7C5V2K9_9FIRM